MESQTPIQYCKHSITMSQALLFIPAYIIYIDSSSIDEFQDQIAYALTTELRYATDGKIV